MNRGSHLPSRIRSFRFAFRGIGSVVLTQHNAWVHALTATVVIATGLVLGFAPIEWCLLGAMMTVRTAEALNTALEFLAGAVFPECYRLVARAKDVAAGSGLVVGSFGIHMSKVLVSRGVGRLRAGRYPCPMSIRGWMSFYSAQSSCTSQKNSNSSGAILPEFSCLGK